MHVYVYVQVQVQVQVQAKHQAHARPFSLARSNLSGYRGVRGNAKVLLTTNV